MKTQMLFCLMLTVVILSACSNTSNVQNRLTLCTEPRPEVCTQDYNPVEAEHFDGSRHSYSNACMACNNKDVKGVIRSSNEKTPN
jgi:hypothetical protein